MTKEISVEERELFVFLGEIKEGIGGVKHDTANLRLQMQLLNEKQAVANGRVTKLETRMDEHEKLEGHPQTVTELGNLKVYIARAAGAAAALTAIATYVVSQLKGGF